MLRFHRCFAQKVLSSRWFNPPILKTSIGLIRLNLSVVDSITLLNFIMLFLCYLLIQLEIQDTAQKEGETGKYHGLWIPTCQRRLLERNPRS